MPKVEMYQLVLDGEPPRAQVVELAEGAEVVDAFMDGTGSVLLTIWPVNTTTKVRQVIYLLGQGGQIAAGARFVRTAVNHDIRRALHVFAAPVNEHSLRDVEEASHR